jgi:hypothetical protein
MAGDLVGDLAGDLVGDGDLGLGFGLAGALADALAGAFGWLCSRGAWAVVGRGVAALGRGLALGAVAVFARGFGGALGLGFGLGLGAVTTVRTTLGGVFARVGDLARVVISRRDLSVPPCVSCRTLPPGPQR